MTIAAELSDIGSAGVPEVEELRFLAFQLVAEDLAGDVEQAFPLLTEVNVWLPCLGVDVDRAGGIRGSNGEQVQHELARGTAARFDAFVDVLVAVQF